jgi:hypothetical protein
VKPSRLFPKLASRRKRHCFTCCKCFHSLGACHTANLVRHIQQDVLNYDKFLVGSRTHGVLASWSVLTLNRKQCSQFRSCAKRKP